MPVVHWYYRCIICMASEAGQLSAKLFDTKNIITTAYKLSGNPQRYLYKVPVD